jgi:hypothetical protein
VSAAAAAGGSDAGAAGTSAVNLIDPAETACVDIIAIAIEAKRGARNFMSSVQIEGRDTVKPAARRPSRFRRLLP